MMPRKYHFADLKIGEACYVELPGKSEQHDACIAHAVRVAACRIARSTDGLKLRTRTEEGRVRVERIAVEAVAP